MRKAPEARRAVSEVEAAPKLDPKLLSNSPFRNPRAKLLGDTVNRPVISEMLEEYDTRIVKVLNDAAKRHGLDDRFEIRKAQLPPKGPVLTHMWEAYNQTRDDGMFRVLPGSLVYSDKIDAALRLSKAVRENRDVLFSAPTQSGKTITVITAAAHHAMWCAKFRPEEMSVIVNPTRLTGDTETQRDFEYFKALHGSIQIKGCESIYDLVGADDFVPMIRRSSVRNLDLVIEAAVQNGKTSIVLFVDEADEAIGRNSILARMIARLEGEGFDVRLVLITATTYHFDRLRAQGTFAEVEVKMAANSGYFGYFEGKQLPVNSYSKLARLTKHSIWEDFTLTDLRTHLKKASKTVPVQMVRSLGVALADLLLAPPTCKNAKRLGLNGMAFNGGQGSFVRFDTAERTNFFNKHAVPILEERGIKVLQFSERDNSKQTLSAFIDAYLEENPDSYFIVVVKGAGRRADRVPPVIKMFFDFTFKSSQTAAEQGTVGRATGYTPDRVVFLSDYNAEAVALNRHDYATKGRRISRPSIGPNTRHASECNHMVRRSTAYLDIAAASYPTLKARLEAAILANITTEEGGINKTKRAVATSRLRQAKGIANPENPYVALFDGKPTAFFDFVGLFAPERDAINRDLRRLHGPDAEMLLPGDSQQRNDLEGYECFDHGFGRIECRNDGLYQTKGKMQERIKSRTNDRWTEWDGKVRRLQIGFNQPDGGKLEIARIRFLTTKVIDAYSIEIDSGTALTEADYNSYFHDAQG